MAITLKVIGGIFITLRLEGFLTLLSSTSKITFVKSSVKNYNLNVSCFQKLSLYVCICVHVCIYMHIYVKVCRIKILRKTNTYSI